MGADNKDIEVLLEVLRINVANNVIIPLGNKKRVKLTEDITEVVSLDLVDVGTVTVVRAGFKICWKVIVSTAAGVVTDIVVAAGNGGEVEMITVVGDTVVVI